jgi:hypothetical protein
MLKIIIIIVDYTLKNFTIHISLELAMGPFQSFHTGDWVLGPKD